MKVVCINDNYWTIKTHLPHPVKGEIYTVEGTLQEGFITGYYLTGFDWIVSTGRVAFDANNFRPVDDTFGEVVAEIIEKQVEVEEMEKVLNLN